MCANYIKKGKLWEASKQKKSHPAELIEIDKADIEFPNDFAPGTRQDGVLRYTKTIETIKGDQKTPDRFSLLRTTRRNCRTAFLRRLLLPIFTCLPGVATPCSASLKCAFSGKSRRRLAYPKAMDILLRWRQACRSWKKKPSTSELDDWAESA